MDNIKDVHMITVLNFITSTLVKLLKAIYKVDFKSLLFIV